MAMMNPAQFVRQVRAEAAKIVWPTRRETLLTTLMVFIMATIAAAFFFGIDQLLALFIDLILRSGG
jgi:preprotein translocase subunit SecE